jgi:transposase
VHVDRQDYNALPTEAQEDLRRKAVKAVLGGKKQIEVAAQFGITRQAVNNWIRAYRTGGMRALKAKPKGRPRLVDVRRGRR